MDENRRHSSDNRTTGRRPEWLKARFRTDGDYRRVNRILSEFSLNTVCTEARCPNAHECWSDGTATFLILGDTCTRNCRFCSVTKGKPAAPDPGEPGRVADAVEALGLDHAVITSVTRDDLPDEGAGHFADTIRAINERRPGCAVEVLIPDFNDSEDLLTVVLDAGPDVLGHNVETVRALYRRVRPLASYTGSLNVLERAALWRDRSDAQMAVKCGIMAGLGETIDELIDTMRDIVVTGCDILTVGQYLQPTKNALPADRYYTPQEFDEVREKGMEMGFKHVESGPLVRSSFHAGTQVRNVIRARGQSARETG